MVEPQVSKPKYLKEGEVVLSSECNTLLQNLPSEKSWIPQVDFHLYHGFWYPPQILNSVLSVQKNFRPNNSDILLATPPKSGTTWLKALVFSLLNRHRHPAGLNPLLKNNPQDLVPFLELNLFMKHPNPDLSSNFFTSDAPRRFFSTHIPFSSLPSSIKSSRCKIVYLSRNPSDVVTSLWHFANNMAAIPISLEEAVDKFCRGISVFGPFWDHVLEYWKATEEMPNNVLFLKYEEIKEQPDKQLRKLANFLDCPFSQQEESNGTVDEILKMCSFESLSGLQVNITGKTSLGLESKNYFRQGKVGDSANYLTHEMTHKLDRITEEKLHGSTLKFI